MPDHGLNTYDAGPGLDRYKRHYANVQAPVDTGVLVGCAAPIQASRLAGRVWRLGENVMPSPARTLMARARRRMDQIAAVDTTLSGRASGAAQCVSKPTRLITKRLEADRQRG